MIELYVLDENLNTVWQVDSYNSLIWSSRYRETGDCELYLPASVEALDYLRKGYFLLRPDDDMICRINYIELDTSAEDGNCLIVKGIDVKSVLDQRVIEGILNLNGNAEDFTRSFVQDALGSTASDERQIQDENGNCIFVLDEAQGFTDVTTEDVSFRIVGEKIREYCNRFGWGYKVFLNNGNFVFSLYKGTDRSGYVTFSPEYENIITSTYIQDATEIANAAFFAGVGEGSERYTGTSGGGKSGFDRFEIFVDEKSLSKQTTWGQLSEAYSGITVYQMAGQEDLYWAFLNPAYIQIMNDEHLDWLENRFENGVVETIDGVDYYKIPYDVAIAEVPAPLNELEDDDNVNMFDVIYIPCLYSKGFDALAAYGEIKSFDGVIEPNTTFKYKEDYFLGDIVRVENEFGIVVDARITEIIEVEDDTGYNVEPYFEYKILGD